MIIFSLLCGIILKPGKIDSIVYHFIPESVETEFKIKAYKGFKISYRFDRESYKDWVPLIQKRFLDKGVHTITFRIECNYQLKPGDYTIQMKSKGIKLIPTINHLFSNNQPDYDISFNFFPISSYIEMGEVLTFKGEINNTSLNSEKVRIQIKLPEGCQFIKIRQKNEILKYTEINDGKWIFEGYIPSGTYSFFLDFNIPEIIDILHSYFYADISVLKESGFKKIKSYKGNLTFSPDIFSERGILLGEVIDEEGKGIPNVPVILENGSDISTDENGKYCFLNLSPGYHTVKTIYDGVGFIKTFYLPASGMEHLSIKVKHIKQSIVYRDFNVSLWGNGTLYKNIFSTKIGFSINGEPLKGLKINAHFDPRAPEPYLYPLVNSSSVPFTLFGSKKTSISGTRWGVGLNSRIFQIKGGEFSTPLLMEGISSRIGIPSLYLQTKSGIAKKNWKEEIIEANNMGSSYNLHFYPIVPFSEIIKIEERPTSDTSVVISSRLVNNSEYEIDYPTGMLIFNEPIIEENPEMKKFVHIYYQEAGISRKFEDEVIHNVEIGIKKGNFATNISATSFPNGYKESEGKFGYKNKWLSMDTRFRKNITGKNREENHTSLSFIPYRCIHLSGEGWFKDGIGSAPNQHFENTNSEKGIKGGIYLGKQSHHINIQLKNSFINNYPNKGFNLPLISTPLFFNFEETKVDTISLVKYYSIGIRYRTIRFQPYIKTIKTNGYSSFFKGTKLVYIKGGTGISEEIEQGREKNYKSITSTTTFYYKTIRLYTSLNFRDPGFSSISIGGNLKIKGPKYSITTYGQLIYDNLVHPYMYLEYIHTLTHFFAIGCHINKYSNLKATLETALRPTGKNSFQMLGLVGYEDNIPIFAFSSFWNPILPISFNGEYRRRKNIYNAIFVPNIKIFKGIGVYLEGRAITSENTIGGGLSFETKNVGIRAGYRWKENGTCEPIVKLYTNLSRYWIISREVPSGIKLDIPFYFYKGTPSIGEIELFNTERKIIEDWEGNILLELDNKPFGKIGIKKENRGKRKIRFLFKKGISSGPHIISAKIDENILVKKVIYVLKPGEKPQFITPPKIVISEKKEFLKGFKISLPKRAVVGKPFKVKITALNQYNESFKKYKGTLKILPSNNGRLSPSSIVFTPKDKGEKTVYLRYSMPEKIKILVRDKMNPTKFVISRPINVIPKTQYKPKPRRRKPVVKLSSAEIKKLIKTGMKYFIKGKYREAKKIWQKILASDPNNAKAKRYLKETEKRLK